MKRFVAVSIFLLMVLMRVSSGSAEYRATLMLASATSMTHPNMIAAQKFADLIKERSNGRIDIKLYPEFDMGERKMTERVQKGTIDLLITSTGPLASICPSIGILDFPFMFRDFNHVDMVMDGPIGSKLLDDFDKVNIKALAFWENGFRHLTNSKRPIGNVEDATGLRIRTMENEVHMASWKAAGLHPISITWGEVLGALRQNLVDCQENPIAIYYTYRLWDAGQKNLSLTAHVYSPSLFLMNKSIFDTLTIEDQEMFRKTAREMAKFQRQISRDSEEAKLQEIAKNGIPVVRDVDRESFKKAMLTVYDEFTSRFPKAEIEAIMNAR